MAYAHQVGLGDSTSALCDFSNPASPLNNPNTAQQAFNDCAVLGLNVTVGGSGKTTNPFGGPQGPGSPQPGATAPIEFSLLPSVIPPGATAYSALNNNSGPPVLPLGAGLVGAPNWLANLVNSAEGTIAGIPWWVWIAVAAVGALVVVDVFKD